MYHVPYLASSIEISQNIVCNTCIVSPLYPGGLSITVVGVNMVLYVQANRSKCRVDKEIVKYRCVLLLKYLDHKKTLELQALYCLQILVHQLGHPPSKCLSWDITKYTVICISSFV